MRNAGAMTLETAGLSPGRPWGRIFDLNVAVGIAVPAFASGAADPADAEGAPW